MYKLLFILLFIFSFTVNAQIDREFWFAVPEVTAEHADRPIRLHLSSQNKDAQVTISVPANSDIEPIELFLPANTSIIQDLTPFIAELENTLPNTIVNKGLLIESDYPITAYYEVLGGDPTTFNTDIFTLKGSNALGLEFFTPFQTTYINQQNINAWSSIDIVATEDNTTITVELTDLPFGGIFQNFTIVLNRGQTYSIRCKSTEGSERLSGSKITSDKPIAVTLKDDSILGPTNDNWDLAGDQIVPTSIIGTEYIVNAGELFIVATQNGTSINLGGTTVLLDEGETYPINLTQTTYINSNAPIYLWQILAQGSEYGGALIPHIQCSGSYNVGFNRTSANRFTLFLLVQATGEDDFLLNDEQGLINATDFQNVPGTGGQWKYLVKDYPNQEITPHQNSYIENTSKPFQMGFTNGSEASGNRYGYFSNYNVLELGIDFYACDNTVLEVPKGLDSYLWSNGSTENFISVDTSGIFWVQATEGGCSAADTIDVEIRPGVDHQFINDTFICSENGVLVETEEFDSTLTYKWNTDDSTNFLQISEVGEYSLTITNEFLCRVSDQIKVESQILKENVKLDTLICGDRVDLVVNDNATGYYWLQDQDTISKLQGVGIIEEGEYQLVRTSNCGTKIDTFLVEKRAELLPPNIITPNNDNINDEFTIALGRGTWHFEVFNRWGRRVYGDDNFKGNWSPQSLSDGDYYYLIEDQYCDRGYNGWLHIAK